MGGTHRGYRRIFNCGDQEGFDWNKSYGQFWGMRSGSGLVLGSGDGLAVAEADAANDVGETL
jgi:hypothetical protein